MLRYLISTLIVCAASAIPGHAQRLHVYPLAEAEGLPDVRAVDLDQSPDGRIWIATRGGIFEYDGSNIEGHLPGAELPPDFVPERIATDPAGGVWAVGTLPAQGLLRLGAEGWEVIAPPTDLARSRRVRELEVLERRGAPALVVVATLAGVHVWDGTVWSTVDRPLSRRAESVHGVHIFEGELFLATSAGVEVLRAGEQQTEVLFDLPGTSDSVAAVRAMRRQDGSRRIWMVGSDWLGAYEGGELVLRVAAPSGFATRPDSTIRLLEDGRGGVYIGTDLRLFHHDSATGLTSSLGRAEGLVSEGATSLARDLDHNTWVCSMRGITRIPPQRFANYGHDQGLFADEVSAILELAPGRLVLGHTWGLSLIETGQSPRVASFPPENTLGLDIGRVFDLCATGDEEFWIAANDKGLGRATFAGRLEWIEEVPAPVLSLARGGDGRLWVGSTDGLWIRNPDGHFVPDADLGSTAIRRLYQAPDGALHAAALPEGLFVRREGIWTTVQPQGDPQSEHVYSILVDDSGSTWVGTNRGLFQLEDDELRRRDMGFRIDVPVYAFLQERAGALWFGTSEGALRWDGRSLERFGSGQGLAGREVNRAALLQDSLGSVWIGTDGGVSRYLGPAKHGPRPVRVELLDITWSDPGGSNSLRQPIGGYSDLDIRFRAITFEGNGQRTFRARLAGFDQDWVPERAVGDGRLRYTNLPPGDYRIELQARSHGAEWGPITSSESFTVSDPFWQRGRIVVMGLALLGALLAAVLGMLLARRRSTGLALEVRETREALEGTEQRYGEMFEQNPSILLLLEPETGRILETNAAAAEYFGNTTEALRQQTLNDLTGLSEERLAQGIADLAAGAEWVVRPAEEDPVFGPPIELRASRFTLRGEEIVQATIHDIETQQQREQELLETQKLRAMGELASGVAHDFNNVLTAILGHNELIELDADGDGRLVAHVANIRVAGEQGTRLVRQLLAFGRRQSLRLEALDVNEVIRGLSSVLRTVLGGPRLELELDELASRVRADRGELEEILLNLVLAARDGMPAGGVLTVRTATAIGKELAAGTPQAALDAECVRLSILCAGEADSRGAAGEPSDAGPTAGELLGLGLTAVEGLVARCGGSVHAAHGPRAGLAIDVFLPAVQEQPRGVTEPLLSHVEDDQNSGGHTALLVDDDAQVRRTIAALLRSSGFRVLEAGDARAARECFHGADEPIDLLVTDIHMPGEDGRALGESLLRAHPKLRRIYMSGYYDEATAEDEEVFLSKPFTLTKLERALERAGLRHRG
jgi:PAS domain S-box-containing protein